MKKFNEPVIEVVEFAQYDIATAANLSNPGGNSIDQLPEFID